MSENIEVTDEKVIVGGKEYTHAELANIIAKSGVEPAIVSVLADVPDGHMRLASGWLKMNKLGSNVQLQGLTPAEALYLAADHNVNAGGNPLSGIVEYGTVERTPEAEKDRLLSKYGERVDKIFPGALPQMPETFDRAFSLGLKTKMPSTKLTEVDIAKA